MTPAAVMVIMRPSLADPGSAICMSYRIPVEAADVLEDLLAQYRRGSELFSPDLMDGWREVTETFGQQSGLQPEPI